MSKSQLTKNRFLELMAAYVLENGLNAASLRPLAKAAGTSDRMLVYHFGSKEDLIAELLQFLSEDMAAKLDLALPPNRAEDLNECMTRILHLLRAPLFRNYLKVWLEILSEAGQGNLNHKQAGTQMINSYLDWLMKHIPAGTSNPDQTVALLLTLIEGVVVMDTMGRSDIADTALETLFS